MPTNKRTRLAFTRARTLARRQPFYRANWLNGTGQKLPLSPIFLRVLYHFKVRQKYKKCVMVSLRNSVFQRRSLISSASLRRDRNCDLSLWDLRRKVWRWVSKSFRRPIAIEFAVLGDFLEDQARVWRSFDSNTRSIPTRENERNRKERNLVELLGSSHISSRSVSSNRSHRQRRTRQTARTMKNGDAAVCFVSERERVSSRRWNFSGCVMRAPIKWTGFNEFACPRRGVREWCPACTCSSGERAVASED